MKICSNCGNKLTNTDKKCIICKTNAKDAIPISDENDKEKIDDIVASVRAKGNTQVKKKPKGCLSIIIVIVAIAIIASIFGSKDKENKGVVSSTPQVEKTAVEKALEGAVEVDYKTLHKDYMDNAIAADAKYKNKMLILTGKVDNIDREIAGNPYITFNIDDFLNNVRITFDKNEESKVAGLSKGQTIKIVGKCTGTLLSTTVVLDNALIIE